MGKKNENNRVSSSIIACKNCTIELVNLLIEKGSNVNEKNKKGDTALSFAMNNKNMKMASFLKDAITNPEINSILYNIIIYFLY